MRPSSFLMSAGPALGLLLLGAIADPLGAQTGPAPCSGEGAEYRAFDFWVGHWSVHDPATGQQVGTNRITLREDRCLLLEDWRGASGSSGMSLNFHDPARRAWRQVWQSATALIEIEGGPDEDGRMVMEGTIQDHVRGEGAPFRARWTPRADGTVLQEFWQQDPDGSWRSWFVGEYRRLD